MALARTFSEVLGNPTIVGMCTEMFMFLGPIGLGFAIGIVIGWAWKPRWASFGGEKIACSLARSLDLWSPSSPLNPVMSSLEGYASSPCLKALKMQSPNSETVVLDKGIVKRPPASSSGEYDNACSGSNSNEEIFNAVTLEDLRHLCQLVEEKDGGPSWIQMMDKDTPNMSYQAWRREPKEGPPQYRSRTIFEDATAEIARDFFWDDEFRSKWDDMHAKSTIIEECPTTGTMKVQWVRKFPFFCKDREYIIGRRIWESGRSYYCVTKGVDCPSIPKRDSPRRVDLYYSSWCIRAVESKRAKDQFTACEVVFFHHEEMGIPWEIAKLGVRKGMWGTVQKMEPGFRAYQQARAAGESLSRSAFMAQVNTKINPEYLKTIGSSQAVDESETASTVTSEKPQGLNIPKILIFGGAIALACSVDGGLVTKTLIFGVARRVANLGRR